MEHPVHECIDGERDRAVLSAEQRRQLDSLEAVIGSAARPLRMAPVPDLTASIMKRVAATSVQPRRTERLNAGIRHIHEWFWSPRLVRVRPAWGVALVAAMIIVGPTFSSAPPAEPAVVEDASAPRIYVQFRLEAQGAVAVALAGSFTGWRVEHELRETEPGTWSILLPLRPGVHDYAFVVDGHRWVADPHAFQIEDGFGGMNSRIALPSLQRGSPQS